MVDAAQRAPLLELARNRGRFRLSAAARRLGLTPIEAKRLAESLWEEGLLEPDGKGVWRLSGGSTSRERFYGALEAYRGRAVTAEELRRACGLPDTRLHYFIKEALEKGALTRERRGLYRVSPKNVTENAEEGEKPDAPTGK